MANAIDDVLDKLQDVVTPIVQHIEQSVPTTKDHYGDYMSAIQRIAEMLSRSERNTAIYLGIGVAMQRAGANKAGVQAALRALGKL